MKNFLIHFVSLSFLIAAVFSIAGCSSIFKLEKRLATKDNIIGIMPDRGQGYLVFSNSVKFKINNWKVSVIRRTVNEKNIFSDLILETVSIKDRNYWRVPEKYLTSNAYLVINVKGYNNENKVAEQENRIKSSNTTIQKCDQCPVYNLECQWICNGVDYAWSLSLYVDANHPQVGPSILELSYAGGYYTYIDVSNYNDFCTNPNTQHRCYPPFSVIFPSNNLVGFEKDMGPWKDGPISTEPIELVGKKDCSNGMNWFINLFNLQPKFNPNPWDNYPPLGCKEVSIIEEWITDDDLGKDLYDWLKELKEDYLNEFIDPIVHNSFTNFNNHYFMPIEEHLNLKGLGEIDKITMWNLENFNTEKNENTFKPKTINVKNGVEKFILKPSLYYITFYLENGNFFHLVTQL